MNNAPYNKGSAELLVQDSVIAFQFKTASYSELTKSCSSPYVKIYPPPFNIPFAVIHLSLSLTPKLKKQMIYKTCFNIKKKTEKKQQPQPHFSWLPKFTQQA